MLTITDVGELKVGYKVNLERAVSAGVRFGGHFVQVFALFGTVRAAGSHFNTKFVFRAMSIQRQR